METRSGSAVAAARPVHGTTRGAPLLAVLPIPICLRTARN